MNDQRDASGRDAPNAPGPLRIAPVSSALDDEPTVPVGLPTAKATPTSGFTQRIEPRRVFDAEFEPEVRARSLRPEPDVLVEPLPVLDLGQGPTSAAPHSSADVELAQRSSRPVLIAHFEPETSPAGPSRPALRDTATNDATPMALPPRRRWAYYAAASLLTVSVVVPVLLAQREEARPRAVSSATPATPRPAYHALRPAESQGVGTLDPPAASAAALPRPVPSASAVREPSPPVASSVAPRWSAPSKPPGETPPRRPRTLDGVDIETPLIMD